MTPVELAAWIEKMPGSDGWWHSDGCETFQGIARDLVRAGLTTEKVQDILERAFGAVAGEYGA
jgi:hypothetical protein